MAQAIVGAREPKPEGDGSSGWYPDPTNPRQYRAWDGAMWTDRTTSAAFFDTSETRYAWSTLLWGAFAMLCSVLPIASWLAVFVCGPFALYAAKQNRGLASEAGVAPSSAVRLGVGMGLVGMGIGLAMSAIYWMNWTAFTDWLNSA